MKMFRRVLNQLRHDFLFSHHLRAVPFGIILALIAVAPFVMLCVNLLLLYVRFVYLYLFIINLLLVAAMFFAMYLYGVTLKNYRPNSQLRPIEIALSVGIVLASMLFVVGTILILLITPTFI